MLKHIPLGFYFEDPYTYREVIGEHTNKLEQYFIRAEKKNADCCVKGYIDYEHDGAFDECGMERLVMLIAGMLFCMDNGGISDDDPADLAYNTWLAIQDFSTGEFDDLFRPGDLADLKADIRRINEYFDQHPKLKGRYN